MKISLRARFWLWVHRQAAKVFFYSDRKNNELLSRDNSQCSLGTSSNNYLWEKIWDGEDSVLYSFEDGEPIK